MRPALLGYLLSVPMGSEAQIMKKDVHRTVGEIRTIPRESEVGVLPKASPRNSLFRRRDSKSPETPELRCPGSGSKRGLWVS